MVWPLSGETHPYMMTCASPLYRCIRFHSQLVAWKPEDRQLASIGLSVFPHKTPAAFSICTLVLLRGLVSIPDRCFDFRTLVACGLGQGDTLAIGD